jgi:hypothetical protein
MRSPAGHNVGSGAGPGAVEEREANLPQGSETILLVEDDPRLLRVISKRLRSLGYQIIEADNGVAARHRSFKRRSSRPGEPPRSKAT